MSPITQGCLPPRSFCHPFCIVCCVDDDWGVFAVDADIVDGIAGVHAVASYRLPQCDVEQQRCKGIVLPLALLIRKVYRELVADTI